MTNARVALAVLAAGLIATLGVTRLLADIDQATGSAACLVRAEYEMISCVGPPPSWGIPASLLAIGVAGALVGLAVGLSRERLLENVRT